jgi:hypothetical protein
VSRELPMLRSVNWNRIEQSNIPIPALHISSCHGVWRCLCRNCPSTVTLHISSCHGVWRCLGRNCPSTVTLHISSCHGVWRCLCRNCPSTVTSSHVIDLLCLKISWTIYIFIFISVIWNVSLEIANNVL